MGARSIITLLCIVGLTMKFSSAATISAARLTSLATGRLNSCEKAIWSCCQHDRPQTKALPTNCFETNGCYGLQWLGQSACSDTVMNHVAEMIERFRREIDEEGVMQTMNRIRY